jgi:uncharacterized protein
MGCKIVVTFAVSAVVLAPSAWAQKVISDENPVIEEFTTFDGSGLDPAPTAGQLDSDEFAGTGMSDGDVPFGGSATSGDWARGESSGGVTTGGLYAWAGGPDRWLFVQPGASDFNPGSLTIRYVNGNAQAITTIDVSYQIEVFNDQDRSNSWNFSYSTDDVVYTPVPALDFASPDVADPVPSWLPAFRNTTIAGLSIPNGGFFYIRFTSADVSGTGSRDEIGVDKISVSATNLPVELLSFDVE